MHVNPRRLVRWGECILTISTTAVRNESEILYLVHKILQRSVDGAIKVGFQQALDDPVAVPIIYEEHVSLRSNNHREMPNIVPGSVRREQRKCGSAG